MKIGIDAMKYFVLESEFRKAFNVIKIAFEKSFGI